jgi:hypothetical protein
MRHNSAFLLLCNMGRYRIMALPNNAKRQQWYLSVVVTEEVNTLILRVQIQIANRRPTEVKLYQTSVLK